MRVPIHIRAAPDPLDWSNLSDLASNGSVTTKANSMAPGVGFEPTRAKGPSDLHTRYRV